MMAETVVAAFDFDGTLTTADTLTAFVRFTHGRLRFLLGVLRNAPWLMLMKLGLCPNWKAKEKLFACFYRGVSHEQFALWGSTFAPVAASMLNTHTVALLRQHQADGHTACVVTASIDEWVRPVCERLGVGIVIATRVEVSPDGILTGRFLSVRHAASHGESVNCYGPEKVARLLEAFPNRAAYTLYAYGDSRGDDALLAFADVPTRIGQL